MPNQTFPKNYCGHISCYKCGYKKNDFCWYAAKSIKEIKDEEIDRRNGLRK